MVVAANEELQLILSLDVTDVDKDDQASVLGNRLIVLRSTN